MKLAIKGGEKTVTKEFFPWPYYDEKELLYLEQTIKSRKWFSGMRGADPGTRVKELEEKFAAYHEAKYGIACANGTVAIEIALRAAGIGDGDEVIVPALTFIATLSAVLQVNAVPVVVDTIYNTQCIDPAAIERAITKKTKAVIPVHYGGFACDMDRILQIARKHNLIVIADSAHAHGARYKGKSIASLCDLATFSFQESKTMTAGEGGMITTNNADLNEKCVQYRACGRHEGESWYVHYVLPLNYRLAELLAAVLLAQMERFDAQLKLKNENAKFLNGKLQEIAGIRPVPGDGNTDVNGYYLYLLQYDKSKFSGVARNDFVAALNAEGVPCHIGYPWPLSKNPMFADTPIGAQVFPVTEKICSETVVIPHQVLLSEKAALEQIVVAIKKIQDHAVELL